MSHSAQTVSNKLVALLGSLLVAPSLVDAGTEQGFATLSRTTQRADSARFSSSVDAVAPHTVILVDDRVPDAQSFLRRATAEAVVYLIHSNEDGLSQVEQNLRAHRDLQAIHFVTHGRPGALAIGASELDEAALVLNQDTLSRIGASLNSTGDLFLYGCDLAQGSRGRTFVNTLSALTRADVAASVNTTGAHDRGGDWILEFETGSIESAAIEQSAAEYPFVLDTTDLVGSGAWTRLHQGAQFDMEADTQANKAGTEIVGDSVHSTTYANYDDNGTTGGADPELDDILSVRVRIGDETKATHSSYAFFGFDADVDGQLDGFISSGAGTTAIWEAGSDLNTSPATTDIANNPYISYPQNSGNYNFAVVSATNDPDWDGNSDVNGDGNTDVFVSLSIPVSDLDAFLATVGITFTPSTQLQFVALTATQTNSLNADFNGISDSATSDWTQSFATLGIYSDPVDSTGVVDATPPVTPTVTSQATSSSTPTVSGTAEPLSSIDVVINAEPYSTTATAGGTWSITVPGANALPDGTYDVAVTSTDAAGNSSTDATTNELIIDTTAPTVAIGSLPITNIANADSYPISGTCTDGDGDVTVTVSGASPAAQDVTCSGNSWSVTFDVSAVPDGIGAITVTASQTDGAGNTGSDIQITDKDTIAPSLNITDNGSNGDDAYDETEASAVIIAGTTDAEDGRTVTVAFSDDGISAPVVTTAVVSGGSWTTDTADISGLSPGTISITADVSDAADNPAPQSGDNATLTSDLPFLTADDIPATNTSLPVFTGTTDQPPEQVITVRDALGNVLCTATPIVDSPLNTWNCMSTSPVSEGVYTFTAEVDNTAGNTQVVDFAVSIDFDADDDGLPDGVEGVADTDGDGLPDFQDPDSDNDGIPDADEGTGLPTLSGEDTDNDGIDDAIDVDSTGGADTNGNGIDDTLEPSDVDNDGVPDYLDTDSDNDGIPDIVEGDADPDGDSIPNSNDTDSDNDGIPDVIEDDNTAPLSGTDGDADGIDDALDVDNTGGSDLNGDGIDDALGPTDSDADGIPDHLDSDSNNDGVPDAFGAPNTPAPSGTDSDGDGIDDVLDVDNTGGIDLNGDGVDDAVGPRDSDGDGLPDYLETDSDGDGIADTSETGSTGTDTDVDGIDDAFDPDQTGGTDSDSDGIDDATPPDLDNDGITNMQDLDSDNDGVADVTEAGLPDVDGDGLVDDGSETDIPLDTDGDGEPDFLDRDRDNDGVNDIVGTPAEPFDADGDGQIDPENIADNDADGIPNVIDTTPNGSDSSLDSDGDGVMNDTDMDDDNDGIPDSVESPDGNDRDTDSDGIVDRLDADSDNDGIPDTIEGPGSNDGDLDADGVLDDPSDSNRDGLPDIVSESMLPVDTDLDGIPDFQDLDSDADNISDGVENGDFDADGIPDYRQADGGLETAVTGGGAGSLSVLGIIGLALMLVLRRSKTGSLGVLVLLATVVPGFSLDSAKASDNCAQGSDSEPSACLYFSAGAGLTHVDPEGESNGWRTTDRSSTGSKILLGYRFKPRWFAELAHTDAGAAGLGNLNPGIVGSPAITYDVTSAFAGYLLRQPQAAWNLYGKVGISAISNSATDSRVNYEKQTSVQLALGLGGEWRFTRRWFLRLELDSFDRDARYLGLSIGAQIGRRP
jgi:hypothetical protein